MIKLNGVYKKVEDNWVSRFILDEVVIAPLCRTEEDMQYIYSISNETGSRIYELLDGSCSVKDIQEILKAEYQGRNEVIEREVLTFIGDLFEVKLIQKIKKKTKDEKPETSYQKLDKKKIYKTPEIAKVKMQPEQAVLTCCAEGDPTKITGTNYVVCTGACSDSMVGCEDPVSAVWYEDGGYSAGSS